MIIMPNWVRNALIIKGKTEDIYEFCKNHIVWHRGTQNLHFDFNTVFPEPECEEECPDKFNRGCDAKFLIEFCVFDFFIYFSYF